MGRVGVSTALGVFRIRTGNDEIDFRDSGGSGSGGNVGCDGRDGMGGETDGDDNMGGDGGGETELRDIQYFDRTT